MNKRFIAAILLIVMAISAVPVFAAGSISGLGVRTPETAISVEAVVPNSIEAAANWTNTVRGVMYGVNENATKPANGVFSFAQIVAPLYADAKANAQNEGLSENPNQVMAMVKQIDERITLEPIQLSDFARAMPGFAELKGDVSSPRILTFDALRGVSEKDLSDYMIFIVNPKTGQKMFIRLNPKAFISRSGSIGVRFLFEGLLTLVKSR